MSSDRIATTLRRGRAHVTTNPARRIDRGRRNRQPATLPILVPVAKSWILHTETKGTGAQMVPLESVQKRPTTVEPVFVLREGAQARKPPESKPRARRRFRIVDVMT